jgi:hypothetical protein
VCRITGVSRDGWIAGPQTAKGGSSSELLAVSLERPTRPFPFQCAQLLPQQGMGGGVNP